MDSVLSKTERDVLARYAEASQSVTPALCCAADYDPKYLEVIPREITEKDYGCGDPSRFVREGDTVLDLGSGSGKICYIAAQIVGPKGRVIGVDFNPPMIALARKYQDEIAERIGWNNVEFRYGKIQDLKTDYEDLDRWLKAHPVSCVDDWLTFEAYRSERAEEAPMIASNSIDVIVSNCVLNLVQTSDKGRLFDEMFRVLNDGGRAAISDIVSNRTVPQHMRGDPDLWSECISGAYQEEAFLEAFARAGFEDVSIVKRDEEPWQVIEGIEFRSVTVLAYKGGRGEGEAPVTCETSRSSGCCG